MKKKDWDEHPSTILFSYRIVYKVAIGYTPYRLVYGLHPLTTIEYVMSTITNEHRKVGLGC